MPLPSPFSPGAAIHPCLPTLLSIRPPHTCPASSFSPQAAIHPYFPLVHVEVQAQVLLFKPVVGNMLGEGRGRRETREHVEGEVGDRGDMSAPLFHTSSLPPSSPVGKVIKVAADFMGLLVLGVFNASVAADCIRPEFKCDHNVGVQEECGN